MEINPFDDTYFMKQALLQAQEAFEKDEVPVGAVIVCDNQIIARAHNFTERLNDVTAHAEMQAFTAAADSSTDCLKGIGVQLNSSRVCELSELKFIPKRASMPLASRSKFATKRSRKFGAMRVLGPL